MSTEHDPALQRLKAGLDALPPVERAVDNGNVRETRRFRGLTVEQAMRYLENLGGKRTGKGDVEGDGWQARLSTRTVPVGPSYRLTEVTITWCGEKDALDSLIFRFRLKAFRGPG